MTWANSKGRHVFINTDSSHTCVPFLVDPERTAALIDSHEHRRPAAELRMCVNKLHFSLCSHNTRANRTNHLGWNTLQIFVPICSPDELTPKVSADL